MFFIASATVYDGTLATDGIVGEEIYAGLEAFRRTGWRMILVTGRELEDLLPLLPNAALFGRIVAAHGVLLHGPAQRRSACLLPLRQRPLSPNCGAAR